MRLVDILLTLLYYGGYNMTNRKTNLIKYIIPSLISNAAYYVLTIVDGMFVGNGVGTDALGAVNIAFPFVMIVGAIAALFTIGGVAVAAVRLGRGDVKGANQAFMHSTVINIVTFFILTILCLIFADKIAILLGANDSYLEMVIDYIFWYSIFLIPAGLYTCLSTFCRNDGNPKLATIAAIVCTILNIFGDWLLVYPLQMGIGGAAIATGVSQLFAVLVLLIHFIFKKGNLRISKFTFQLSLYKKIIIRGLPEMVSQFAAPITITAMNYILMDMGNANVNAYSVIGYAGSLFASLMYGLSTGLQPLFGQSYGAKEDDDLKYYLHNGLVIAIIGGIIIFGLTFVIGEPISILFGADQEALEIVVKALPKYCINFVFATSSAVLASYLFSTKRSQYATILNVCRSIIFNFLCITLLPRIFGNDFVWYSMGVSEFICVIIAVVLWKVSEKNGVIYR